MHAGVHLVNQVAQLFVRLAIPARFKVVDLALRINDEDFVQLNPDIAIAHSVGISVAKPAVKRVRVGRKEVLNCLKTSNLEDLGLLLNDFTVKRAHQSVWAHDYRTFRQTVLALAQVSNISARRVCLSNCSSSQIENMISVVIYTIK